MPGKPEDLLLTLDENGEAASEVLGFKKHKSQNEEEENKTPKVQSSSANKNPEIHIRYSQKEMLRIFKTLGRFEHPLQTMSSFKLKEDDIDTQLILEDLTNPKP